MPSETEGPMLSQSQQIILFWVFVGFFVVIGVIALLAIVGVIKTNKQFLKWAVTGFVTGVAGVVFVWAKFQSPLDIYINLKPPEEEGVETFELVSGNYEYTDEQSSPNKYTPQSGTVMLTAGQQIGWWTAKFPYKGTDKAVKLTLKDNRGKLWKVRPFYPNYQNQTLFSYQPVAIDAATTSSIPFLMAEAFAAEEKIKFNNFAKIDQIFSDRRYYKWRVFVDEPDQVLNKISEVQYLLHPTFPEPLQVRTNPDDKFAVEASGWGEFNIQITVKYKDKSTVEKSYHLDFNKKWP